VLTGANINGKVFSSNEEVKTMTIIASVKVRDGIVLATDSMNQVSQRLPSGQVATIKTYSNARKLFRVKELPIGIMTYGLGNIGARSIESLVLEFSRSLSTFVKKPYKVKAVSLGLHGFIKKVYDEAFQGIPMEQKQKELRLGFLVGGYSPRKFLAHEWEFELPQSENIREIRKEDKFGSSWRGVPVPFSRLYNGFDGRIPKALKDAGVADNIIEEVINVEKWRMPIAYDGMPVQDAINFAIYILETTIGAATFEVGTAPSCGGPLQVAAILPDKGWQWVQEPKLIID
jgi:hypothetical protein